MLTRIMSKAMNRSLMNIILGGVGGTVIKVTSSTPKAALPKTEAQEKPKTGIPAAVEALKRLSVLSWYQAMEWRWPKLSLKWSS